MARPSLRFRLLASTAILVLALGTAEGLARMVDPVIPQWQAPDAAGVIMTGHPTRLWGMARGVRRNGDTTASINELGLRGTVPEVPRPPEKPRILVLGDSSFFGHGIPDDGTIAASLQKNLQATGIPVEVVNGGIPGYSTEQTKLLLEEVGWSLQPTLLVIGNLWSDNNADGFRDADLLRTNHAFYNNPLAKSAFFRIFAGWVDSTVDRLRGGTGAQIITWTRSSAWPEGKARRVPIQNYARNLDWMVKQARERGVGAMFVTPTNQGLVDQIYQGGAGWDPYFATQRKVAEWNGLPIVSATEAIQADPLPTADKFVDQMHPSVAGAADIGGALANALLQAGWPKNPLLGRAEDFDASGLVDDVHIPPGGQTIRLSPQAQLFPDLHVAPASMASGAPAPSSPSPASPMPPSAAAQNWEVLGRVESGMAPFEVSLRNAEGRPIGFTHLSRPVSFSLKVPADLQEVKVHLEDARGNVQEQTAQKGDPEMVFRLP